MRYSKQPQGFIMENKRNSHLQRNFIHQSPQKIYEHFHLHLKGTASALSKYNDGDYGDDRKERSKSCGLHAPSQMSGEEGSDGAWISAHLHISLNICILVLPLVCILNICTAYLFCLWSVFLWTFAYIAGFAFDHISYSSKAPTFWWGLFFFLSLVCSGRLRSL